MIDNSTSGVVRTGDTSILFKRGRTPKNVAGIVIVPSHTQPVQTSRVFDPPPTVEDMQKLLKLFYSAEYWLKNTY